MRGRRYRLLQEDEPGADEEVPADASPLSPKPPFFSQRQAPLPDGVSTTSSGPRNAQGSGQIPESLPGGPPRPGRASLLPEDAAPLASAPGPVRSAKQVPRQRGGAQRGDVRCRNPQEFPFLPMGRLETQVEIQTRQILHRLSDSTPVGRRPLEALSLLVRNRQVKSSAQLEGDTLGQLKASALSVLAVAQKSVGAKSSEREESRDGHAALRVSPGGLLHRNFGAGGVFGTSKESLPFRGELRTPEEPHTNRDERGPVLLGHALGNAPPVDPLDTVLGRRRHRGGVVGVGGAEAVLRAIESLESKKKEPVQEERRRPWRPVSPHLWRPNRAG